MYKNTIFSVVGLAGLAVFPVHASAAVTNIYMGGSYTQAPDMQDEENVFNAVPAHASKWYYVPYTPSTNGAAVQAAITNESSCLAGGNVAACSTTGNAFPVHFTVSDLPLTSADIAQWNSAPTGAAQAGYFQQVPTNGWAVAIPVVNSTVTTSGQLALTDTQLCGIFSGLITNWSQVSSAITAGAITVEYPTDPNSPSYYLLNHLAAVCTTGAGGNSNFKPGFTASENFTDAFASFPPATGTFKAVSGGSQAVASDLQNPAVTSAISFLSADYSSLYPMSDRLNAGGARYNLVIAAVKNGTKAILPTVADISTALANADPAHSINSVPPQNTTQAHNQLTWLPVIGIALKGYPIVGYSSFLRPQCYKHATVFTAVDAFHRAHQVHLAGGYLTAQNNNGLAPVVNTTTDPLATVIRDHIIGDKPDASGVLWHINQDDAPSCDPLVGRG